jgi:hypothetical protein
VTVFLGLLTVTALAAVVCLRVKDPYHPQPESEQPC